MQWIIKYLTSSIGKKQIMGCSGAAIALFVLGHMIGNLQLINLDQAAAQAHTVYLRIENSAQPSARKIPPILKMFPGKARVVLYFADTGARMGGSCALDERLLRELREQLGEKNVVIK